jgi:serine phosphatase RsbU (regulator of sigma subunit)
MRHRGGNALGLESSSQYSERTIDLGPGDLVLFFTDGVLKALTPGGDPIRQLGAACLAAGDSDRADALLQSLLNPTDDEACALAVEWVGA